MPKSIDELRREHDFLICIDSDGCVYDSMEVKHKECFCPATVNVWELQGIAKYAREAYEYVNLYSRSRGANRFPALVECVDLLRDRPEVTARGTRLPDMEPLRRWIAAESKLGNPALVAYCAAHPDDELMAQTLRWSNEVNANVERLVRGVPPFPCVRESLAGMQGRADVIVVSGTPTPALLREWEEHDIAKYVKSICGQEVGTKKQVIARAKELGYDDGKVLMIGDAPGDHSAAAGNNALFFPINPGAEESSWQSFYDEALARFFDGAYDSDYAAGLLDKFYTYLPETPPWKR